jgi:hypothetical protein
MARGRMRHNSVSCQAELDGALDPRHACDAPARALTNSGYTWPRRRASSEHCACLVPGSNPRETLADLAAPAQHGDPKEARGSAELDRAVALMGGRLYEGVILARDAFDLVDEISAQVVH